MVLTGKFEADVELMASADAFFNVWSKQAHLVHAAAPGIHGVEVHEGDWEAPGSIKQWKYSLDGKTIEVYRERIHVDDEKKHVMLEGLEGSHVLERFKSFKVYFHAFPKDAGCVVKTIVEYEKKNENDPPPEAEFNFAVQMVKDIGAHLCKK